MWSHEGNKYANWSSCKANYQRNDGSSDEDDKFLLVLVRLVDKDSGLIATLLLDIPNSSSGSTAHQMDYVCNEIREAFSLDWNNCEIYSSDNINPMMGQLNNLLKLTKRFLTLAALVIQHICVLEREPPKNFLSMLKILLLKIKTKKTAKGVQELSQ